MTDETKLVLAIELVLNNGGSIEIDNRRIRPAGNYTIIVTSIADGISYKQSLSRIGVMRALKLEV